MLRSTSILLVLCCILVFVRFFGDDQLVEPSKKATLSDGDKNKKQKLKSSSSSSSSSPSLYRQQKAELLLNDTFGDVQKRVREWKDALPSHYGRAQFAKGMNQHKHNRFFPFQLMATCRSITEVGRDSKTADGKFDDDSKMICGLGDDSQIFQQDGCIIYSIGGNNEWLFEEQLLKLTKCEIHTFDCTGPKSRFGHQPQHPRSFFHHICLGDSYVPAIPKERCNQNHMICGEIMSLADIQQRLKHTHVELIKMDIEGYEIPLMHSWWRYGEGQGDDDDDNNNNATTIR
uniref:Methyltransferase domain-containing protein n=1 Tax=Cyclophora tenuis TaxID=216820 RepID=A0A7S1D137_CYCTE|mmetsp:Transcript_18194/g.31005  ORF Transcript_18194/g.31005 Transcript_18194/m.31005 type:complete len:288 (+) Transcript_18194:523-1386(+)